VKISIVIADDQRLLSGALASLLGLERDFEVQEVVADGASALASVQRLRPDVLLSDIEMPGFNGLELAAKIQELGLLTRVVIVTAFARPGYLRRALDAGVRAYLLKDTPSEKLADVIRTVHRGGKFIQPELATQLFDSASPLSERERRILLLAGDGLSSEDIAAKLFLSRGTVRNYLSEAMGKLGAANRVEAFRIAREKGWL
jgi:two-component system response regulator DesR